MKLRWFFGFFFISGACSLVYEVVWLRLAMASFGVTTPLVSIVLSAFMAGLAIGSWGAGSLVRRLGGGSAASVLRAYALTELIIGLSSFLVPLELRAARGLLETWIGGSEWASLSHYLASGLLLALILVPFSTAMGATFPLGMQAIRGGLPAASAGSFSYLYLANVLGATCGTLASALVLIELLGFRGTLLATGALNGILAVSAFAARVKQAADSPSTPALPAPSAIDRPISAGAAPWLLFTTGLLSMALEVVWVRQFTPFLGTVVYAFAVILAIYLGATCLGSLLYRMLAHRLAAESGKFDLGSLCAATAVVALLPLVLADPRRPLLGLLMLKGFALGIAQVAIGIGPFCLVVGFLTPMLVDRWSQGEPRIAGHAYAINVLGCIVGPLLAGFVLLPAWGERWSMVGLALPLLVAAVLYTIVWRGSRRWWAPVAAVILAAPLVLLTRDYETIYPMREVRRDYTATVIAAGEGMQKQLLVNGYGMTVLTPVTKMMAHLPLAFRASPPRNVLVICFGMGTSFRSSVSWGVPTTAVELIPSVPMLFEYFHADAASTAAAPGARIVVDDGRRFLERTGEHYDVITVDPPPPVEAAGSSLLYSREFLQAVRSRLTPDGILQEWFPGNERVVVCSVARALKETFPYARAYHSYQGTGYHFLASLSPIPDTSANELAFRLPSRAAADLVEWEPGLLPLQRFEQVLSQELPFDGLVNLVPDAPPLQDDRPINEYYLLRRSFPNLLNGAAK